MRYRYLRSRDRDRERYLDAVDEARENVLLARREDFDALGALDELEAQDEDGDAEDRES